jgi:hypothetical protein
VKELICAKPHFMDSILSGAIGGIITGIALPLTSYATIRSINHYRTRLQIEKKIENSAHGYDTLSMRLVNNSWATLKNVIPYIVLQYQREWIETDPNVLTYTVDTSNKPLMLSWAKVVSDGNAPNIDINQQEEADLNVFRFHHNLGGRQLLHIASEQGFGTDQKKGRVLLKLNGDLQFEILVTAENMFPIRKSYLLQVAAMRIIEWE